MRSDADWLALDIRSLERQRSTLHTIRGELTSRVIVMGPGSAGRDALTRHGGGLAIDTLIAAYDAAVAELDERWRVLAPEECDG